MQAFVYRWRELSTSKWYIGYHKGTPGDGYICSSSIVKPLIQADPNNWQRKILRTGSIIDMVKLEQRLLIRLSASKNSNSYNRNNGQGHSAGGRTRGSKDRFMCGFYVPDKLRKANTVNAEIKQSKSNGHGGKRKGAGRPKGSSDHYGLYKLMKGLQKIGICIEGISLEDAKQAKLGFDEFKFVVVKTQCIQGQI